MAQSLLEDLPEQAFTDATIKRIFELVNRAKTDATFQKVIYDAVNRAMPGNWKNYRQELSTILKWTRTVADYRRDPYGVELLQDVWATLDRKRGDCDDFTVLLCSAAEVLGCPCRIVTVSTRKDRSPNHVYPEANVNGKWLGMDATMQGTALGWQPSHVTDKKIWTRRELGLAGGESDLEGLGMMGNGYHDVPGFKSSLYPVSDRLAPGVPDDIAETFADPRKGNQVNSRRPIWNAPIANNADRTSNPRAGGGVYQAALPIKSMPTPSEIWSLIDRKYVPKILDPDAAWWGKIQTSKEDLNRMFPGSEGTMSNYLTDIASVPASAIAELTNEVVQQARLEGLNEYEVGEAIEDALQGYALGLSPKERKGFRPRLAPQKGRNVRPGPVGSRPAPPYEKKYMVPGPRRLIRRGGHLNGLGSILDDLAAVAASAIKSGATPTAAVNAAVDTVQGAILPKPVATTMSPATVAKTAIPVGVIALVVGAALLMSRSGGARKYRSNPSRRRSRGGRRGGMDMQKMLLLGGAGAAAWYLFLRPGATMLPSAIKPAVATPLKSPSTRDQVAAAVVSAAPSIFDAIKNIFSPGTPVPGAVTDLNVAQGTALPGVQTDWSNL